jgi:hypothetical protein
MPKGPIVIALLALAVMIAAKDGRLPRAAGLTASCQVARLAADGSQVVACRSGAPRGAARPDPARLHRDRPDGDVRVLELSGGSSLLAGPVAASLRNAKEISSFPLHFVSGRCDTRADAGRGTGIGRKRPRGT